MLMNATATRSLDVIRRFFHAYLWERDLKSVERCLADDVRWIGTGAFERAGEGFHDFRELLNEEFRLEPGPYPHELSNLHTVRGGSDSFYVDGDLAISRDLPGGNTLRVNMRISAMCREEDDGICRICGLHASVPSEQQADGKFFPVSLGENADGGMSPQSKEQAFELLKDSLPGGLIGGFVEEGFPLYFVNDNLIRHLGYASYEEFVEDIGGLVENGMHPEDRDYVNRVVETSLSCGDTYEVVYRMLKKDGSFIWVQDRGRVTTDGGRKVIVSIVIDITEQRRLQERLKRGMASLERKNAELGAFYQVVVSGIAKISDDPGYTLLYANDQFFGNIGYTREEIRTLFNNESLRLVHPDDVEVTDQAIRELKDRGRFSIKLRFIKKNGNSVRIRLDGCQTSEKHDGYNVIYCFYTDIEEQERRNADYQRQQYFMSMISSSLAGGSFIACARPQRPLVYVSDSLLNFLGYAREDFDLISHGSLANIIHAEDRERVLKVYSSDESEYYEEEYRVRKANGSVIWVLEKGRRSADEDGRPVYICILLDITSRKIRHDELLRQTRLDPLTGLYNHEYARQYIQTYLDIHQQDHASALLLFDLDNFKQVNDRHGHLEGDAVLVRFGKLLGEQLRSRDFIARTGGDEFLAFMQDVPSSMVVQDVVRRVSQAMRESLCKEYSDCGLALSVGMALSTERMTYDTFFHAADEAMYRMKYRNKGHNEEIVVQDLAERDFERQILFSHAFGIVLRIDLDKGTYHIRYGSHAVGTDIPPSGPYEKFIRSGLSRVIPEDRESLLETIALPRLIEAFERGENELFCEVRVKRAKNDLIWIRSGFRFLRTAGRRLAYHILSDVTESRKQRDQSRLAELYAFTQNDTSDEIYELDMSIGRYRTIRSSGNFSPLPTEGTVQNLQTFVRDSIIYPDDREHFDLFHFRARQTEYGRPSRGEFRCLWRDGSYHWVAISVLSVKEEADIFLVCVTSIEDRKRLEAFSRENAQLQQTREEEERYRIIVNQSRSIVLDIDLKRGTVYAPYLDRLLFCPAVDPDNPMTLLTRLEVHQDDRRLLDDFHALLRRQPQAEATLRLRRRDGAFIWCRITATVRRDSSGNPVRLVGTIADVDENVRTLRQLRYQAEHDPVTGYSNLTKFKLDAARLLAEPRAGRCYGLWYLDFLNFKYINDMYGYDVGNALLRYYAELIADSLGSDEAFARTSADNFVLLCSCRDPQEMIRRFHNSVMLLGHFEQLASRQFRVELVGGCYLASDNDPLSIDDMLDRANIAQKSVKHLGGSRYVFYSEDMRKKVLYEKELESSMEKALHNGEFLPYLQPQIDIQHGNRLFGAEALVRWRRPGRGLVQPSDFIPLFERNGFIVDLDAFMFEQACVYVASRSRRGLPPLRISVNISRMSLSQQGFLDRYAAIRNRHAVPAGMLELECTENLVVKDFSLFRTVMAMLPAYGFRRAMDDFGTGYSSLNMLKDITLDVLKLDMDFFRNTKGTPRERAIIEGIVQMSHALGMNVVAEGIESLEQVELLRSVGCDAVQGYIFSRPVPVEEFEALETQFAACDIEDKTLFPGVSPLA